MQMINYLDVLLYNALVCLMLESSKNDIQLSNIWYKYYRWENHGNERE